MKSDVVVFIVNFVFFVSLTKIVLAQLYENDSCKMDNTNQPGSCRLIDDCPQAIDDLRRKQLRPTPCGWVGTRQIVCCPLENRVDATSSGGSKSDEYCRAYSDYSYETININIFVEGQPPVQKKVDKCGNTAIGLIVGGTTARGREFPHMALIGYGVDLDRQFLCGGSLVSEHFVLTAAHCSSSTINPPRFVRLGELDQNRDDDDARPEEYRITQIINHPSYTAAQQYNDISLLRLERAATLSSYVRPICLPLSDLAPNVQRVLASGWGRVGWSETVSPSLLKVTLDLFSHHECNESYKYNVNRRLPQGIIERTQICAGSRNSEKDTCEGDSGGPLQIYRTDVHCSYTIVGITSFGKGCGLAGSPAVYTRVYPYVEWIESIIWP